MGDRNKYLNVANYDINAEDDNENDIPEGFALERPAVVFCIDGRKNMFADHGDSSKTPFLLSLECVREFIRNHIFKSIKCFTSILIMGTKKSDNAINLKNVTTISTLKHIGGDSIKAIEEIIKSVENNTYETNFGLDEYSLSDGLWCAANILNQMKGKFHKKIIVFTNNDDPYGTNRSECARLVGKMTDFERSKIAFQLINIGDSFNVDKHFKELLQLAGSWDDESAAPCNTLELMISRCGTSKHRNVALSHIPLYLSSDFCIGVSVHRLAKGVKLPYKTKLSKATNEPIQTQTEKYSASTGEVVDSANIMIEENHCGESVCFKPDEVKLIKKRGESMLRLLGFKPKSTLSLELHSKPSAFVYPSESKLKGSTLLFTSLLERCQAKSVVPICTYCPRATSSVRFVALLPQMEIKSKTGIQEIPSGFILVFLPFGDDVRDCDDYCLDKKHANPEQIEVVKQVINKMKSTYKPEKFPCPKLAKHWAGIEALALNLPDVAPVTDETVPNYAMLSNRLAGLPEKFREVVYSDGYFPQQTLPKKKSESLPVDAAIVEDLAKKNELDKLKIDQMKKYLVSVGRGNGLSKMKKSDLMEKIYAFVADLE